MSQVKVSILNAGFCTCPEHLAIRGGGWRAIHFPAMFALLEHPRLGLILFDTGYSYNFFKETRAFPSRFYRMMTPVTLREEELAVNQLKTRGLHPGDISQIIISHFHADHIAALNEFSHARFTYFHSAYENLSRTTGAAALSKAFLPGLIPSDFIERSRSIKPHQASPLPPDYAPFTHGFDVLGDGSITAVELPGHASGQMGLLVRSDSDEIYFFVADAAWLFRNIELDRPPHFAANLLFSEPQRYQNTLHQLHLLHHNRPDIHIIPSHCAQTLTAYQTGRS